MKGDGPVKKNSDGTLFKFLLARTVRGREKSASIWPFRTVGYEGFVGGGFRVVP